MSLLGFLKATATPRKRVTPEDQEIVIANSDGRRFLVRVVRKGDRYGLNDSLTHQRDRAMVEFYDLTFTKEFGPRGQFVSRYFLDTFMGVDGGLALEGNFPEWQLSSQTVSSLQAALRGSPV